jgi:ribonuclease J
VVALDQDGLHRDGSVPAGYLYVDGTVGDVGHGVLRDRRMLADEGVVMVVANVDLHTGSVIGTPRVITRGWVHAPEAEDLLEESATVVGEALAKAMADGARDAEVLGRAVRRSLGALVSERTRRRPLIIPVVLAV